MFHFLTDKAQTQSRTFTLVVDCGDPGTPWHGYLHGSNFKYGSKVTFSCRAQHHLDGEAERACQANGQWSGEQPKCLGRKGVRLEGWHRTV